VQLLLLLLLLLLLMLHFMQLLLLLHKAHQGVVYCAGAQAGLGSPQGRAQSGGALQNLGGRRGWGGQSHCISIIIIISSSSSSSWCTTHTLLPLCMHPDLNHLCCLPGRLTIASATLAAPPPKT
jgi:hypothetical protein